MEYGNNVSYLFIPFSIKAETSFYALMSALEKSLVWIPVSESDTKYMLKYVANKLNCKDKSTRLCFHYRLREDSRRALGLGIPELSFVHQCEKDAFHFQFLDAHLYCFSTGVCIIALKLHIEAEDPLDISNAQYYLKKVSRCVVTPQVDGARAQDILVLSQSLVRELPYFDTFDFFFYSERGQERANLLTYLEVSPKAEGDFDKELYFLRHCYSKDYLFRDNEAPGANEFYLHSSDIRWGISPEAAVCLTCPVGSRKRFIQEKFFPNFNTQYLFMYVLLLHQKYVLYLFLTRVNTAAKNNLQAMEDYRRQLYEFEMNYIFTHVTEVPQYQELYSRISQSFSLVQLFQDVQSPLVSLSEVRQEAIENQQKERDKSVNHALLLLSVLSFFSALIDSSDFVRSVLGPFLGPCWTQVVECAVLAIIFVTGFFIVRYLWRSTRD